ncbi:venom protein 30.1-like [Centruroides vittatus]|uniref:venom protein 30.1-like n=1 Tax=Centruroides vittatus TaxID=120091 RepID=UPI0035106565
MNIEQICMCLLMASSVFALSDVRFKYYETEKHGNKCRFNKLSYLKNDEGIFDVNLCKMYTCHILENKAFIEYALCKAPNGYREGCTVEQKIGKFPYCCFNRQMTCPPLKENDKYQHDDTKTSKISRDNSNISVNKKKKNENCPCLD